MAVSKLEKKRDAVAFDPLDEQQDLTVAIISLIEDLENTPHDELPVLAMEVNMDAVDALLETQNEDLCVRFSYCGYSIEVHDGDGIYIFEEEHLNC